MYYIEAGNGFLLHKKEKDTSSVVFIMCFSVNTYNIYACSLKFYNIKGKTVTTNAVDSISNSH